MNAELKFLIDKYQISQEQIRKIFERFILPELNYYSPSQHPTAVIVGAQPGAGKTQVLNRLKAEFQNYIVICNADDFRKYHPHTSELLRLHELYFPDITSSFAQQLNLMLRNECKGRKLNFALEITMRDGTGVNDTIRGITAAGFQCQIDLLAVNEKWSRLGTVERLEAQRAIEKSGRIVTKEVHDDRYHAMPAAVKQVADNKLFDRLRIFGRTTVITNGKTDQALRLISENPVDPFSTLLKERNKLFTREEIKHFTERVEKVAILMKNRNAGTKEIADFIQSFLPNTIKRSVKKNRKL